MFCPGSALADVSSSDTVFSMAHILLDGLLWFQVDSLLGSANPVLIQGGGDFLCC